MGHKLVRFALAGLIAGSTAACAHALRSPQIVDLRDNPGRYQHHIVSIDGTVTTSWGIPLVPFKLYKVDDGTGEVTVRVREREDTDARGARPSEGPGRRCRRPWRPGRGPAPARGSALREAVSAVDSFRARQLVMRMATAVMSSFGRRIAAERLNLRENRVDDLARRPGLVLFDDCR